MTRVIDKDAEVDIRADAASRHRPRGVSTPEGGYAFGRVVRVDVGRTVQINP